MIITSDPCWHARLATPIVVPPKHDDRPGAADPMKEPDMTPQNGTQNLITNPSSNTSFTFGVSESSSGDAPEYLTFDEMRELPMHLALGFDIED